MGFRATWATAVGGMIGGGIFTVLGVGIAVAGSLPWLAFVVGGVLALLTGLGDERLATEPPRRLA